jgi:hypothetical protein
MQTGCIQPGRSVANGQTRKSPLTEFRSPGAGGVIAARSAAGRRVGDAASPSPPSTPSIRPVPSQWMRRLGVPLDGRSTPWTTKHGAWARGIAGQPACGLICEKHPAE